MEIGKSMNKYFKNHCGITMFLSAWICFPIAVCIFRYIPIPALAWHDCFKLAILIIAFCSNIFFLMGWIIDCNNRYQLKRDFLKKLES